MTSPYHIHALFMSHRATWGKNSTAIDDAVMPRLQEMEKYEEHEAWVDKLTSPEGEPKPGYTDTTTDRRAAANAIPQPCPSYILTVPVRVEAFRMQKQPWGKVGVPMSMLINESEAALQKTLVGAEYPALTMLYAEKMIAARLKIVWPAHPDYDYETVVNIANPNLDAAGKCERWQQVTRLELARQVARAFKGFVQETQTHPAFRSAWEDRLRFGGGAMFLGGFWLISLWRVSGQVLEAEVQYSA
ncbi:hypothetical protein BD413DRAFT_495678 [Trametes elegans]|nr:hypothetical protein BD413DRAFT_495678 [Trametes elegans]